MNELLQNYRFLKGSDVHRDGMYLELIDKSTDDVVAEIFYSDVTREMTVSVFKQELPLACIEMLVQRAKQDLPPSVTAD